MPKTTQQALDEYNKRRNLVIEGMETCPQFLDDVVIWIVTHGYDKKFKKCNGTEDSPDCVGVGLASTFHGRKCRECSKVYKRQNYAVHHAVVKRKRKEAPQPKKKKDTTMKKKSSTVKFKRGTKKE
jgi:hypothetical protein